MKTITEMTPNEINRELCKRLILPNQHMPDFFSDSGKVQLLREMRKRNDWQDFLVKGIGDMTWSKQWTWWIDIRFLFNDAGLLVKAALEWLRKKACEDVK